MDVILRFVCIVSQASSVRYNDKRLKWIHIIRRVNPHTSAWYPKDSDRVCSEHFLDKIPTAANPDPTLKLGYERNKTKARRSLYRGEPHKKMVKVTPSSSIISHIFKKHFGRF